MLKIKNMKFYVGKSSKSVPIESKFETKESALAASIPSLRSQSITGLSQQFVSRQRDISTSSEASDFRLKCVAVGAISRIVTMMADDMELTQERRSAIKRVVREALTAKLGSVKIVDINVASDCDAFGDPILRIKVIYEDRYKQPLRGLSSLVRNIRPGLSAFHEERFPVMSFIADSELEDSKTGTN